MLLNEVFCRGVGGRGMNTKYCLSLSSDIFCSVSVTLLKDLYYGFLFFFLKLQI